MEHVKTYIFFDTETTGLVDHKRPAGKDQPKGLHLCQIAAVITDEYFNEFMVLDMLIHPEGKYDVMPPRAFEAHGLTVERLEKEGLPLRLALGFFSWMCQQADIAVCHNTGFDVKMMETLSWREDIAVPIPATQFCSMTSTTDLCKLPGNYGYKWPQLQELHEFLFGERFEDAHNALIDIRHTIKCVKALKERKLIMIP